MRRKSDRLVNKLFPGTIARVDKREDGFVRTSNVTKFLAGSSSVGVSAGELFHRDDLIEATGESLSRVARTILALSRLAEFPGVDRPKIIQGQQEDGGRAVAASLYGQNNRAAASTPNLSICQLQRSTSPVGPGSPVVRKRWSPHQHLPTVRSDSPNEDSSDGRTVNNDDVFASSPNDLKPDPRGREDVRPSVPPRSPLRVRPVAERVSVADSTRASVGDSIIGSLAESVEFPVPIAMRQSQASSNLTDTTMFSSLLEPPRSPGSHNKFGTIRTVTTDVTSLAPSESPSITRTEGSSMAPSFKDESRIRSIDSPSRPSRERRPSETAIVDLSRVVEEAEDSATSRTRSDKTESDKARAPFKGAPIPIKLGKGKWPDDFIGVDSFQASKSPFLDDDDESLSAPVHTPLSVSPPRSKLAFSARSPNESVESLPQFPRRPTHRARHSVDTPGLLPKDQLLPRDSSPDASGSPPRRIVLRRSSSKAPGNRNGVYIPRREGSASPEDGSDGAVPFPRTVSGEHSTPPGAGFVFPSASPDGSKTDLNGASGGDRPPRLLRGRFQSEVDAAGSRRKPRPNSFDEYGAKPRRSRFESMVNLGVGSSNASASDLMSRDSYDGSAVRQTLIVREDGKAPTQFVSRFSLCSSSFCFFFLVCLLIGYDLQQLGNCIGRGQFGAVYRALNLNTGQMVAVKRIRLEGLKEDEIAQLMKEVDLVKSLSHPSIVKYEGMARDDDTLNIVLEYVLSSAFPLTLLLRF